MSHTHTTRRGFTLIELIIIAAMLLFLLALLLPMIQKVRDSAARSQDSNNLKQIGIAVHSYHDDWKRFPPAFDKAGQIKYSVTAHIHILPYIEQAALYNAYAQGRAITDVKDVAIPVYIAAQDASVTTREGVQNYAANLRIFADKARKVPYDENFNDLAGDQPCTLRLPSITDGTSNTMMFATKYAVCGTGGSKYSAVPADKFAAFYGQNAAKAKPHASAADAAYQLQPGGQECRHSPLMAQSFSKYGLSVGMCDGSVTLVNPNVSPQTWNAATHPSDNQVIGNDFN
jgi:type II secretory pathway pseudopilin PulG